MSMRGWRDRLDGDPRGVRDYRIDLLKDLVGMSAYDVPAGDIAASIMRDAIVIAIPPVKPRDGRRRNDLNRPDTA